LVLIGAHFRTTGLAYHAGLFALRRYQPSRASISTRQGSQVAHKDTSTGDLRDRYEL